MSLANDMDKWWWGGDEDVYLDPEGKPISKEDYEKQFEGQVKMPVEPDQPEDLPEQPQFVGDPTQFKPMPFDPTNPMMYMGSGRTPVKMSQPAYYKEHRNIVKLLENTGRSLLNEAKDQKNEATATAKKLKAPNPFYHLRGGDLDVDWDEVFGGPEYDEAKRKREEACKICRGEKSPDDVAIDYLRGGGYEQSDDELARRMAEYLAPHISSGIGQVADGIQDFFKSPEQREQEKRDKEALEEAERKKKEREEGSWSSYLSPFFHLSGGAIDKYIAMAKEFAKRAGYKDWDSLRRADDGEHKLELRGVKFGRKGYGDFIKYSLDEGVDEAQKHRSAYLARATNIKGDWAKDMYSPNSLAINILWDGKSSCPMSGGAKTQAELEAMSVPKLIEYGKSQGVKGLDGKTKAFIVDKILKQSPEAEVVAPKAEDVTSLQLYKMLLMNGSLEKDLIPLAKKQGIERILHKNKKTLVNEIYDNLLSNEEIQASDSLENVPKMVMYIFGKGPNPYPDEEEDEDPEIEVDEYELNEGTDDAVTYMVEDLKDGMHWQDRRVFTPTGIVLGTLGEDKFEDLVEQYGLDVDEYTSAKLVNMRPAPPAPVTTTTTTTTTTAQPIAPTKFRYNMMADAEIDQYEKLAKMSGKPIEGFLTAPLLQYYKSRPPPSELTPIPVNVRPTGRGKKPVLPPQDVLEGKKDNPVVEETIEEPMDDGDIRQYLPNAKIMRYSALAKLSDIEQLLPKDKSYVVLLYENTPGSGHWVALMRYGRTIEFFCSYGSKIDAPLRWQNPKDNAMLGQSKPYLSLLLNKAKGKFRAIHNPVAYQSSKQGVATCGAWDVMRINQLINHNQDLHEFHDYMESVKKETGLTYDEIVVNYVSKR